MEGLARSRRDAAPTPAQRAALAFVRARAASRGDGTRARLRATLGPDAPPALLDPATWAARLRETRRVTVNFHPDRVASDGRTVIEALLTDGRYRSQFETGISNGGLTAHPGGDRDEWERRLFGGAYQHPPAPHRERPRYGGLNVMDHPDGACPRFGSCHLRLAPEAFDTCTFSFGDSVLEPEDQGVADELGPVVAALVEEVRREAKLFGTAVEHPNALAALLEAPRFSARDPAGRSLDAYVEAQVHLDLQLADHAEALVCDPSFRGTQVGDQLEALAARFDLQLAYHQGFQLDADALDPAFRGPEAVALAARLATWRPGPLDAAKVGAAARAVVLDPAAWADHAAPAETLQHLKYLWHALVVFGRASG